MIQINVNAFVEDNKENADVADLANSSDHEKVQERYHKLTARFHNNCLANDDLPLDTNLNELGHYPSVAIGKEEFE